MHRFSAEFAKKTTSQNAAIECTRLERYAVVYSVFFRSDF